jgi:hypothetical protein
MLKVLDFLKKEGVIKCNSPEHLVEATCVHKSSAFRISEEQRAETQAKRWTRSIYEQHRNTAA